MNVDIRPIDPAGLSPHDLFLKIPDEAENPVYFSRDASGQDSRWSIIACNPSKTLRWDGDCLFINEDPTKEHLSSYMRRLLHERKGSFDTILPIVSGIIGTLNYEYGRSLLDLPSPDRQSHMAYWSVYNHLLVYDHMEEQWYESIRGNEASFEWKDWIEGGPDFSQQSWELKPQWSIQDYQPAFEKILKNIIQGEIYQACLTFPFFGKAVQNPRHLFIQLFQKNPSPMGAYLEQGSRSILSLSPERFICLENGVLESKPIKGTRPRGATPEDDHQFSQDLLSNEKERAELNMITDLLRNDLAKISDPGSVEVLEQHSLLQCPNVWHTFSRIRSRLKTALTAWDVIEALFPGGSISGCPKRRAVELLSEVEEFPRGIYTGCIGYISDHGNMDLNIAIRTLEQLEGNLQASFGGGIVSDSELDREYQECFDKAHPFISP